VLILTRKILSFVVINLLFFNYCLYANTIQKIDWRNAKRKPDKIASANAVKGGQLNIFGGQSPKSLNYYLDNNTFSANIFSLMYDSLLNLDPITADFTPCIAKDWAIIDDGKEYYFKIDTNAKWSDGKQITAFDVKYTFDAIMDPKNLTGVFKVGLENFLSPEIIDTFTIKFTAKEIHWRNLLELSSLSILPTHIFSTKDFNKINFEFPVVSGAYKIKTIKEGAFIQLERRKNWWQANYPDMKYVNNFDILNYRIVSNPDDAFDLFKKGMIDIYPVYVSRIWINETKGEKFDKNWIIKQKIFNYHPIGFQGWAFNMRQELFNDLNVRKALAHCLNRRMMNEKMMYNQYFLHKSYFEDLYDNNNKCTNQLIEFDKNEARKLLAAAGWKVNKAGKLEKNGKLFSFEFLERDKSTEKFVNVFAEDLKDLGIDVKITLVDFAEWAKRMDEFKFDMTWASWSASLFKDPEGMWHSKEAERLQGNNITGFKNQEVDKLIDQLRTEFNISKRNQIIRKIDALIYNEIPYILLWNINYTRLLYWNKFGMPNTVLSKFGDERSAYSYWWFDKEKATELKDAMAEKTPLPNYKTEIYFDETFSKKK